MKKVRELIEAFLQMLRKNDVSCMAVIGKDGDGCVAVIGHSAEICSGLANCFAAVKKGEANEGQQAIYDIILDVMAVSLSVGELRQLLPPRVDKLIK